MLELIEQKVEGKDISVPPEEKPEAKIIDLMEALKASVGGPQQARRKAPRKPRSASKKPTKVSAKDTTASTKEKKTSKRKTG
jgi:DNA end-binding protein Ku